MNNNLSGSLVHNFVELHTHLALLSGSTNRHSMNAQKDTQGGGEELVNNQNEQEISDEVDELVTLGVQMVVRETLDQIEVDVDDQIKTVDLSAAGVLCQALLSTPNDAGQVRVDRAVLLALTNHFIVHQESAVERLLQQSTDENNLLMEKVMEKASVILRDLARNQPVTNLDEAKIEPLHQRIANLEDELGEAYKDIQELEDVLQEKEVDIKELQDDLADAKEQLPFSRRTKRRNRDMAASNEDECGLTSTSSASTSLLILPSSSSHHSTVHALDAHISETMVKNGKFLQLLSNNPDDIYTFGHCSTCTVILHAMCNTSDLSQVEKLMQLFAIIWDTNMTVTRQAKEKIVCINMKGPMSIALKTLHKSMAQNSSEDGGQEDAALEAYNKYNGTNKTALPSIAYTSTGKVSNHIMIAMLYLIGIRVSKNISLHRMHKGGLTDPVKDAERKQGIAALIDFIVEMTGERPNDSVTIAWIYTNVLVPACDSPSHEVRLRMIHCIIFLIEEMQHSRYFEEYKSAEVIAMTKLADNVDSFELTELREKHKASLYICERKDGGDGAIVASWRRQAVPKVLFSSLCSREFAKRMAEAGLLCEEEIDLFTFGVMNEAVSNFHLKDNVNFLFDDESYRRRCGNMTSIAGEVKNKILDTAIMAMKQFEKETHFAEPKHLEYYKKFFMSMSTEETDNI